MKSKRKLTFDYPDETEGTRWAAKARSECNHLSSEERAKLLEGAMKLIYGQRPKQKVGPGH